MGMSENNSIIVKSEVMLYGNYLRTHSDLRIDYTNPLGESETILLKNYFLTSPDLITTKGSIIKGDIVNLLSVNTTPIDNSTVAFDDPSAIGKITIADGTVIVQRVNQTIELNAGDLIYLNDVVEAKGGSVGIAFADQTTMSVDAGSKMVVDEFVYDPATPTTGSMNANVITGNFSFVSGQIAKVGNDAMTVTTPVLTIGVRGTQVAGKASQEGEENQIVLLPNEDGTVGQILISNQSGTVLLTKAFESTTITSSFMPPTVPVILPEEIVLKKFGTTINTTRRTEKKADEESNIRFNWKMIRVTFFVWERVKEDKGLFLKPKIDTIRAVVSDRRFKQFFYGYFPDLEFNPEKEVKLLNKLVAEKSQKPFFIEGYYKYEGSNRPIPQKHLDHILWGKNKE